MKKINKKAFTIVELVIVIAVMAVLAAVLIPTFSGIIKNSKLRADESEIAAINTQLAIFKTENGREISSEADIYAVIKETYGEDKAQTFVSRRVKDGYHFWYDTATNKVIVSTVEDLDDTQTVAISENSEQTKTAFQSKNERSFKMFKDRYYFLDNGGSDVADVLAKLDSVGNGIRLGDILTSLNDISGDDESFAHSAAAKLTTTAVVAYGTHVSSNDVVITEVYFSKTVETLCASVVVINNEEALHVDLPANVTKVNSYSLNFKTESHLYVDATEEQLKEDDGLFDADSLSNCKIKLNGEGTYSIEGSVLKKEEETIKEGLAVSKESIVTDLDLIACDYTDRKVAFVPDGDSYNLYVAIDYTDDDDTITLKVDKYYGDDENGFKKQIFVRGEVWSATGNIKYDSESSKFTITGFDNADDLYPMAGEIKVQIQNNHYETITVYGVKAVNIKVDTDGVNENIIDDFTSEITLSYDPAKDNTFNFKPSLVLNHSADIVLDDNEISVKADPMEFKDNKLTLHEGVFDGNKTVELTVSYGSIVSEVTYKIILKNNLDGSFAINDTYVAASLSNCDAYCVGINGAFKLSYLFKNVKNITDRTIMVEIYDGQSNLLGEGESLEYSSLDETLDLSKAGTSKLNKLITIKIGLDGSLDRTELKVHFVDATNVTAETVSSMPSGSSANVVLLSDINLTTAKVLNNVYGNLHKINVDLGDVATTDYWDASITLHGNMDNTLVIGPVYPSIKFYDDIFKIGDKYAWDGVKLVSSSSTITNSYVFGFRAPISVVAANGDVKEPSVVKIENTVIEGGSLANMHIGSVGNLILNSVSLVQDNSGYTATVGSGTVYGLCVYFDDYCRGTITLSGNTRLYNWISKTEGNKFTATLYLTYKIKDLINKMVEIAGSNYLHEGYVNTGFVQDGKDAVNTITWDDTYTGPEYKATSNISLGSVSFLKKHYSAWSIPVAECAENGCSGTHTFLPEGWDHQQTNHSANYLNSRT